jgi:hypothetical protein
MKQFMSVIFAYNSQEPSTIYLVLSKVKNEEKVQKIMENCG